MEGICQRVQAERRRRMARKEPVNGVFYIDDNDIISLARSAHNLKGGTEADFEELARDFRREAETGDLKLYDVPLKLRNL